VQLTLDPDISIRGGGLFFVIKQKSNFKQFVLRKINRYRGIIQSENKKKKHGKKKNNKNEMEIFC